MRMTRSDGDSALDSGDDAHELSLLDLFPSTPPSDTSLDTEGSPTTSHETTDDADELLRLLLGADAASELELRLEHPELRGEALSPRRGVLQAASGDTLASTPPLLSPPSRLALGISAPAPSASSRRKPLLPRIAPRAAPVAEEASGSLDARKVVVTMATTQQVVPKRSRKRVKDELESLRQHVADLEEQLRRLQLHSDESAVIDHSVGGDAGSASPSATAAQVTTTPARLWRRVATRQLDARRTVETENARLRGALAAQLKLAQGLARLLRRRPNFLDAAPPPRPTALSSCHHFFSDASTSSSIYTGLAERLGPLYASMDAVLAEAGFAAEKKEVCSARVRSDGSGERLYLELVNSIMLPFGRQTVTAAFWQLFSSSSMQIDGGVYEGLGSGVNSTLRSRFSVNYELPRGESEFHGHLLGQQVLEATRAVLVWNTAGQCEGSLFGSARMQIQEAGWLAIEEVKAAAPYGASSPMTIVQTVLRVHPRVLGGDGEMSESVPSVLVHTLATAVASALPQNLDKLQRMAEDMILGADANGCGSVFHGVCNSIQQHPQQ